jgi:hypothetical protein
MTTCFMALNACARAPSTAPTPVTGHQPYAVSCKHCGKHLFHAFTTRTYTLIQNINIEGGLVSEIKIRHMPTCLVGPACPC